MFDRYDAWASVVPYVQYILNTTVHSVTGVEPIALLMGKHASARDFTIAPKEEGRVHTPLDDIASYIDALTEHLQILADQALNRQQAMTRTAEPTPPIEPGTLVLRKNESPTKLHGHRGPFRITAADGYAAEITPLTGGKSRRVHLSQLIRICQGPLSDAELLRIAATDDEEYYVEKVLEVDDETGDLLIKWLGFPEAKATWEGPNSDAARTSVVRRHLEERGSVPIN
ncbi:Chromo and chromo shadow domain [Carpediemonas membranifera]|uniref:Chromo and chromo shadow domain n=1 Tax=Carpediemonas membranifera TaxID=201153 RepID=A0A8J6BW93_9EUKA|nr:Chromo and chromo shadow domain [Carpediemonas membranifera]|eukprot:KAG9392211.1 Chromo and chromo shadow domain [Carpediemonas membranifera]